jgi:hypothetical protein
MLGMLGAAPIWAAGAISMPGAASTASARSIAMDMEIKRSGAQPRVATPYDRLAANYLAFVQLASIRLWLRVNESAS